MLLKMVHVWMVVHHLLRVLHLAMMMKFLLVGVQNIQEVSLDWPLVDQMVIHGKQGVPPSVIFLPLQKPMLNVKN
jgi:hypothetical protein